MVFPTKVRDPSTAGLLNLWIARQFCVACEVIYFDRYLLN